LFFEMLLRLLCLFENSLPYIKYKYLIGLVQDN
jgi:hypothetical protein